MDYVERKEGRKGLYDPSRYITAISSLYGSENHYRSDGQ